MLCVSLTFYLSRVIADYCAVGTMKEASKGDLACDGNRGAATAEVGWDKELTKAIDEGISLEAER